MGEIQFRRFDPQLLPTGAPAAETAHWLHAESLGFLLPQRSGEHLARMAGSFVHDGRVLVGAYEPDSAAPGWGADRPVATYASMIKGMNVGSAQDLPTHLIADVTVRPTHRGRGLMRTIMLDDLRQAKQDCLGLAALYAARADLYGRFGFGPATRTCRVEVTPREFRLCAPSVGDVAVAEPAVLPELVEDLQRRHHQATFGSLEMLWSFPTKVCGLWAEDAPEVDTSVHAFVHRDDAGVEDGFVTFRFGGWSPSRAEISIIDLVSLNPAARVALWSAVCAFDVANVVVHPHCPPDDSSPWWLVDRRAYRQVVTQDGLWLRVLDVGVALSARRYACEDQRITMRVDDALGLADGTYRVETAQGSATVTKLADDRGVDVTLDVSTLASAFLGGYSAYELAAADRIAVHRTGALDRLARLLGWPQAPYCNTHF